MKLGQTLTSQHTSMYVANASKYATFLASFVKIKAFPREKMAFECRTQKRMETQTQTEGGEKTEKRTKREIMIEMERSWDKKTEKKRDLLVGF